MIKITVIAEDDIEEVSALRIETKLRVAGYKAKRTTVSRLTKKQYDKALGR